MEHRSIYEFIIDFYGAAETVQRNESTYVDL